MFIRIANIDELNQIQLIYDYARRFMEQNGNGGQWGKNFPPEKMLVEYINNKQLYVVEEFGCIHGVFAFIIGKDETYSKIYNGSWLSESEYGTIHRIASDGKTRGIFDEIVLFCQKRIAHLRIDTHENNKIMQHLIVKNGFNKCGIIYKQDGTYRIAYEKLLFGGV